MKKFLMMSLAFCLFFMHAYTVPGRVPDPFKHLSSQSVPSLQEVLQKKIINGITKYPVATSVITGVAGMMAYQKFIGKNKQDTLFIGYQHDDVKTKCGIGLPGMFIGFQHEKYVSDFSECYQDKKPKKISKTDTNVLVFGAVTAGLTYMLITSFDKNR